MLKIQSWNSGSAILRAAIERSRISEAALLPSPQLCAPASSIDLSSISFFRRSNFLATDRDVESRKIYRTGLRNRYTVVDS
jgi:hypothetical protein